MSHQRAAQQEVAADITSKIIVEVGGATLGLAYFVAFAGAAETRRWAYVKIYSNRRNSSMTRLEVDRGPFHMNTDKSLLDVTVICDWLIDEP